MGRLRRGGGLSERGDPFAALNVEAGQGRARGRDVARLAVRRRRRWLPVAVVAVVVFAGLEGRSGGVGWGDG